MNRETAIDELIYKIHQELDWFYPKVRLSQKLVDEMKQLEKQQIIDAYNEGWRNHTALQFKSAERYYNELGLSEYDKHQEVKKGCTGPK